MPGMIVRVPVEMDVFAGDPGAAYRSAALEVLRWVWPRSIALAELHGRIARPASQSARLHMQAVASAALLLVESDEAEVVRRQACGFQWPELRMGRRS